MTTDKNEKEIWWLARGSSSTRRQPSFAPPNARQSVTSSLYGFGWNRKTSSFVTSNQHDLLARAQLKEFPCERAVAMCMLWHYARRLQCGNDEDGIFAAAGVMCRVSSRQRDGEICLHFYSPTWKLQQISLHESMMHSFRMSIASSPLVQIFRKLE